MRQADEILAELAKLGEAHIWEPGTTLVKEGVVADCRYITTLVNCVP